MKKYLILLACTTFLMQDVSAEEYVGGKTLKGETLHDANFMGNAELTDVKATSLSVLGTLEFNNLTVEKETTVVGPISKSKTGKFANLNVVGAFEATDVTCNSLVVTGPATVTGLTVSGEATIVGSLTLKAPKDSKIAPNKLQNLTIAAEEISLEDTDVEGNILVKKTSLWTLGGAKKQVLHLLGKTTVKGTITFESGTGTITQGPDAKVEGKITGTAPEKK